MPVRTNGTRELIHFVAGNATAWTPADATTYTFGNQSGIQVGTGNTVLPWTMGRPGNVRKAYVVHTNTQFASTTGESATIRVKNVTQATSENISTALVSNGSVTNKVSNTNMSLAFAAGDELQIEWVTPTWATNPVNANTYFAVTVEIEYYQ